MESLQAIVWCQKFHSIVFSVFCPRIETSFLKSWEDKDWDLIQNSDLFKKVLYNNSKNLQDHLKMESFHVLPTFQSTLSSILKKYFASFTSDFIFNQARK